MPEPIIFYDLMQKRTQDMSDSEQCWSGNTLKTRFALNIKGLPYRTEWVKFADVGPKMKSLGVGPPQPGPIPYTIPTIVDPSTQALVNDSFAIAQYLDKTYPDTPALVPPGTAALQVSFINKLLMPLLFAALATLCQPVFERGCIDDADRAHYRKTREAFFGKPLEDVMKAGEEGMNETCRTLREGLDGMAKYAKAAGGDLVFIGKEEPWFVDTAIAAALTFMIKACGKEHALSKVILQHEWASRLLEQFEKWA
ncbi:hypothetical protein PENSPDRAFT_657840 [Peniophora sp. CONT]|nr:hypothetical protein PENSPDRAFT_657840 [Peniophora sp. CONT]